MALLLVGLFSVSFVEPGIRFGFFGPSINISIAFLVFLGSMICVIRCRQVMRDPEYLESPGTHKLALSTFFFSSVAIHIAGLLTLSCAQIEYVSGEYFIASLRAGVVLSVYGALGIKIHRCWMKPISDPSGILFRPYQ